jgi:methylated-DNA-[protein]-cysteine S-methyltransferase
MNQLELTTVKTPLGDLVVIADVGVVIVSGWFSQQDAIARIPASYNGAKIRTTKSIPGINDAVVAYFAGDITALRKVPWRQDGGQFMQRAWRAMSQIPAGSTVSYTDLARQAGNAKAFRAAATACSSNLVAPFLPCHLVVRSDGSLGGYYYGLAHKRWLLNHEGVN